MDKRITKLIENSLVKFFEDNKEILIPESLHELAEKIYESIKVDLKTSNDILVNDHRVNR